MAFTLTNLKVMGGGKEKGGDWVYSLVNEKLNRMNLTPELYTTVSFLRSKFT